MSLAGMYREESIPAKDTISGASPGSGQSQLCALESWLGPVLPLPEVMVSQAS